MAKNKIVQNDLELTGYRYSTQDEQSLQKIIKSHIDSFALSDSRKQQMWQNINEGQNRKKRSSIRKALGTAAVFACVLFVGGIGVNAASGGKVAESIRESIKQLCGMEPESVEIIYNMTPEATVYAPPLLECNEQRAVFASSRGMVIYDRTKDKAAATIDLQKIGCNYFETDSLMTKVLIDGDSIQIFNVNVKEEKVQGNCYRYDLSALQEQGNMILDLEPSDVEKGEDTLLTRWKEKMGSRYKDTFDHVDAEMMEQWEYGKDGVIKYSDQSVVWTLSGQKYFTCLLVDHGKYQLYTWNAQTGEAKTDPLQIKISEEAEKLNREKNALPLFVYTGKDEIMKAVCDYMVDQETKEDSYGKSPDSVVIPAPVIYDIVEEKDEVKVFGNFWTHVYYRNGNVLEEEAGGEMPACIHIKKKENGTYQVLQVERSGDGAYYQKGIKKFCEGYPEIYQKYFAVKNDKKSEKIRKKLIEQYVSYNQLDIQYYHDYGWDPVELFQ